MQINYLDSFIDLDTLKKKKKKIAYQARTARNWFSIPATSISKRVSCEISRTAIAVIPVRPATLA